MFEEIELGSEFFEGLLAVDEAIRAQVAAAGCGFCGGRLHRSDFDRKPRGGVLSAAAETWVRRFSLCCGREGCRRRSTPPSVRFLGRRVYVGAAVLVASIIALAATTASEAARTTGIPPRTTRRWIRWWRGPFVATPVFLHWPAASSASIASDSRSPSLRPSPGRRRLVCGPSSRGFHHSPPRRSATEHVS